MVMKAQISAEMILLLVVLLAIVALVANNLMSASQKGGEAVQGAANKVIEGANMTCVNDAQCPQGMECVEGICQ